MEPVSTQPAASDAARAPARGGRTPWYRNFSTRPGFQGKLTVSFMALLLGTLAGSCSLFVDESRNVLDHMAGEQALAMCNALGMASQTPLEMGDRPELARIGKDLLKNREIAAVGFFHGGGKLLALSSKGPKVARNDSG